MPSPPGPAKVKADARRSAKKVAKEKGVYYDLTPKGTPDIPDTCPICGRIMESGGSYRNNSPSLDRILPELGYTANNVWWICHDCNRQKADLTPSDGYALWDRVWREIKERKLPLPATRLRPHAQEGQNE